MFTHPASPIDSRTFRTTMGRFTTGVTVISHIADGEIHGMTANAFISVSMEPPLVLISLGNRTRMHSLLSVEQHIGISVLSDQQIACSNHFAGRAEQTPSIAWHWEGQVPVLLGAIAQITARVIETHPAGDHCLYIAQVESLTHCEGRPLVFHAGQYAQIADFVFA